MLNKKDNKLKAVSDILSLSEQRFERLKNTDFVNEKVLNCNIYRRPRKFKHPISKVLQLLCYESDQKSEQDMDEVTFFYVWELFCIHLDTKYANFQEKISEEISEKNA